MKYKTPNTKCLTTKKREYLFELEDIIVYLSSIAPILAKAEIYDHKKYHKQSSDMLKDSIKKISDFNCRLMKAHSRLTANSNLL